MATTKKRRIFDLQQNMEEGQKRYDDSSIVFTLCTADDKNVLIYTRRDLKNHPPAGLVSRVKIIVDEYGQYEFQVLMICKERGIVNSLEEYLNLCDKVAKNGGYKFCPGFNINDYNAMYFDVIRYDPKSVCRMDHPIARIDSQGCLLWHKLARNASIFEKDMEDVLCSSCKRLRNDLQQRVKRISTVSPKKKLSCVQPSSHFPVKYLSPQSAKKKRQNLQQERTHDKKVFKKYSDMEVTLDEEQHEEVTALVQKISEIGSSELESVLAEGENSIGSTIRAIWDNDVKAMKKEFETMNR